EAAPVAISKTVPQPTQRADATAGTASKAADTPAPAKSASAELPASDSEYVFVSRASLLAARHAADEAAAIATLRSISSAQAQLQYSGAIDTDGDGSGEYGYFGELCGAVPCRDIPGEKPFRLEPAVLSKSFAQITPNGNIPRSGYLFRMYLPGKT